MYVNIDLFYALSRPKNCSFELHYYLPPNPMKRKINLTYLKMKRAKSKDWTPATPPAVQAHAYAVEAEEAERRHDVCLPPIFFLIKLMIIFR